MVLPLYFKSVLFTILSPSIKPEVTVLDGGGFTGDSAEKYCSKTRGNLEMYSVE